MRTIRIIEMVAKGRLPEMRTLQQLREAIPSDHSYRFLLHDRDTIFSAEVDQQLKAFGLWVLRTPVRAPKAKPPTASD